VQPRPLGTRVQTTADALPTSIPHVRRNTSGRSASTVTTRGDGAFFVVVFLAATAAILST
jgi:hypothetical protein